MAQQTICDQCGRTDAEGGSTFGAGWIRANTVPSAYDHYLTWPPPRTSWDFCGWACLAAFAARLAGGDAATVTLGEDGSVTRSFRLDHRR